MTTGSVKSLRDIANPYDFSNPVSDERSFYGRTTEAADVIYYLNHAKNTRKPIHLALVGARASGKTSFLNMAELEARRREFCTVRINLNEGDVKTDLDFFRKFMNSIMTQAFSAGAYGGRSGRMYFSYLELTATGEIDNLENVPLVSSVLISKAVRANNSNFNIPDDIIQDDLVKISEELQKNILVLIDECNVLKLNRIILEKIRNIFMNMSGYMFMFAATDDFFPVMDDVFSPIMRQFKRIDIGPFKGEDDVRQCVRGPLERVLQGERSTRDLAPDTFISEVDTLSGRKPYEVQLICHELFRRCQEGRSKRFSLNLNTLESIQQTLAKNQNIDDRPLIKAAKKMKANLFNLLEAVSGGTEYLSLEDTWRIEHVFQGSKRWDLETYKRQCEHLQDLGFISVEPHAVRFRGDQFERIYLKYLARSKGAGLHLSDSSVDSFLFAKFASIASEFDGLVPIVGTNCEPAVDISYMIEFFREGVLGDDFDISPLVEDILVNLMYQDAGSQVRLIELRLRGDICNMQVWFIWQEPEHIAGFKKQNKRFAELKFNANAVGLDIEIMSWDINVLGPDEICSKVKELGDEQLSVRVANELMEMVQVAYVRHKDKKKAMNAAKAAFGLQQSRLHSEANNVGYLYMDSGDYLEAELWFQAARQYCSDESLQLHHYNMGVLRALMGDIVAAKEEFSAALRVERDVGASCVHKLLRDEKGAVGSMEINQPDLLRPMAEEALAVLEDKCGATIH